MKRKQYVPKGKLLTDPVMASMRETAFGKGAYFAVRDVVDRAERLRDDTGLLSAAEEKRKRKAARNIKK